jgi:4'-phosphopantetheinyl transferase
MKPIWPIAPNHPPLTADTVHVWAVAIDATPHHIDQQLSLLSADEQRRASLFQVAGPRRQFIVTRSALRTLLGRYLTLPPDEISLEMNANGKPRLAGKHAALALQFNVAHSNDLALIAFALGTPIGIDVECHRVMRLAQQISQRYFHAWEAHLIDSAPAVERDAMFLRCWTAKEAILKAIGTGLTDRLSQFFVPFENPDVSEWFTVLGLASQGEPCFVRHLAVGEHYHAALAVTGTYREVSCMAFTP